MESSEMAGSTAIPVQIHNTADVGSRYPLNGVREIHAQEFHERNQLPIEKDVFVRGVLAVRHQDEIEVRFNKIAQTRANNPNERSSPIDLKIGTHQYTRLESDVLYNAWTRNKKETFRNLSRLHRLLIVACIYAAVTQGWDQAAMAGAAIEVMKDLAKPTTTSPSSGFTARADNIGSNIDLDHNAWLLGLTVGVPFFAGAILGLIITDPVTGILGFGRRGAICVAGVFSFISVIGSASVNKWEHLLGFRILLGAGMAGKASIVPILLSETSPKNIRGFLLVFWQLFVAFGLAAGSVANLSVYRLNVESSWRYMFIAAFIPALLLLSLILFSPESPRWLLKESGAREKGRSVDSPHRRALVKNAYKSLIDLRGEPSPILAAGELYLMHTRLIDEQHRLQKALSHAPSPSNSQKRVSTSGDRLREVVGHIGWWPRVRLMFFRSGFTRRAHMAAFAVMISQQLCGINLVAFLADTFFRYSFFHDNHHASPSENVQLLGASFGLMLLNFLATIPALFIIDGSNGRRRALNWSFPCMAISLLASALVLKDQYGQPSIGAIVGHYIFLGIFMIAYSIGEGPAAFVISAEVFPLVNRELGMSLAVFWNFMGAGLLAVISPWLLKQLHQFGVLMLFAGTNLLAWFLCFWLVPSTGNEDLEDVFAKLEVPSGFMLVYLVKVLLWKVMKLVEFCRRFGNKNWQDCGYGPEPGDPMEEFEKSQERARRNQSDANNASESSGIELV